MNPSYYTFEIEIEATDYQHACEQFQALMGISAYEWEGDGGRVLVQCGEADEND